MKTVTMLGVLLLALGLAGVIWGVVEMYEDRDTIDLGKDAEIVLDDGDFPPLGIAGAIAAGVGAIFITVGAVGGRRRG
ncbi:MAG: hypothetical protein IPK87_13085 [Planctomycetes bacterium]|nr:hypothetical protein [Planctomycetota bacterium]